MSEERNGDLDEVARAISETVCRQYGAEVDSKGRFPSETFDALRSGGLLCATIPGEFGGRGASLCQAASIVELIASECPASGLILAMHYSQLAILIDHGHAQGWQRAYLESAVTRQPLIASSTSENGAQDMRRSCCHFHETNGEFTVQKQASVISYGEQADAILVTARRSQSSAETDQAIALLTMQQIELNRTRDWRAMGMRGTCSHAFELKGRGPIGQVLQASFGDIATSTLVPISHYLWAACWFGISRSAYRAARHVVRADRRKSAPAATWRLAELRGDLGSMRAEILQFGREIETRRESKSDLTIAANLLKIRSSRRAVRSVALAAEIVGIRAFMEAGPVTLSRQYRDVASACVMINNLTIESSLGAFVTQDQLLPGLE